MDLTDGAEQLCTARGFVLDQDCRETHKGVQVAIVHNVQVSWLI